MEEVLLELDQVSTHYEKVEVLKNISMKVGRGQIATLIGSNGAGKTTTLRVISGLKRPTKGGIRFEGERIDRIAAPQTVGLGIAHVPEGRLFLK